MCPAVRRVLLMLIGLFAGANSWAQPVPTSDPGYPPAGTISNDDGRGGPTVLDSGVGFIDNAILGDQLLFRYDTAYNHPQPARAEFIWAVGGPFGPGPGAETGVDYQDFSLYAERRVADRWSIFGEAPARLLNPELQPNEQGLGDINVGFKRLLTSSWDAVHTFQFRVYVPTADETLGLGTGHVSVEPGYLFFHRHDERTTFQGEVRDWIAIGGTDGFAGNVLRYGLGVNYQLNPCDCRPILTVFETVGWTVLNGNTAITTPPPTQFTDAAGDTIVNAKLGLRFMVNDRDSIYAGYGHVLTDEQWYSDVFRFEYRRAF